MQPLLFIIFPTTTKKKRFNSKSAIDWPLSFFYFMVFETKSTQSKKKNSSSESHQRNVHEKISSIPYRLYRQTHNHHRRRHHHHMNEIFSH